MNNTEKINNMKPYDIKTLYDCLVFAKLHPKVFVFWNTTTTVHHYIYYDDVLCEYLFSTDNPDELFLFNLTEEYNLMNKNVGYKFRE